MIDNFEKLHHANLILGNIEALAPLKLWLKRVGFETRGNPDYFEYSANNFGVDDARMLTGWAYGKPIGGEKKVAIIVTKSMTHEAQNALLKTLEEPTYGTYFFIIIENLGDLLGTLLSRVQILPDPSTQTSIKEAAHKFAQLGVAEKIKLIKELAKDEDKDPMREIVRNLERTIYHKFTENRKESLPVMKRTVLAKRLVALRGASPKMLLEWLTASML